MAWGCSGRNIQQGLHHSPAPLWLSLQALETKVESQGCKIVKSRLTSTCAAFESLNADNARVELFVDPTQR